MVTPITPALPTSEPKLCRRIPAGKEAASSSNVFFDDILDAHRHAFAETAATETENGVRPAPSPARPRASHCRGSGARRCLPRIARLSSPISQDRAENVVEVMSDAARQRTDTASSFCDCSRSCASRCSLSSCARFCGVRLDGRAHESIRLAHGIAQATAAAPAANAIRHRAAARDSLHSLARRASFKMIFQRGVEARSAVGMNDELCQPCAPRGDVMICAFAQAGFSSWARRTTDRARHR